MPLNNPWTLLLLAISAEVIGTSCLRLSEGMTRPVPTLLVFSAYAIAMGLLSKVVMSLPLGLTYALWSASAPSQSFWWVASLINKRWEWGN